MTAKLAAIANTRKLKRKKKAPSEDRGGGGRGEDSRKSCLQKELEGMRARRRRRRRRQKRHGKRCEAAREGGCQKKRDLGIESVDIMVGVLFEIMWWVCWWRDVEGGLGFGMVCAEGARLKSF